MSAWPEPSPALLPNLFHWAQSLLLHILCPGSQGPEVCFVSRVCTNCLLLLKGHLLKTGPQVAPSFSDASPSPMLCHTSVPTSAGGTYGKRACFSTLSIGRGYPILPWLTACHARAEPQGAICQLNSQSPRQADLTFNSIMEHGLKNQQKVKTERKTQGERMEAIRKEKGQ